MADGSPSPFPIGMCVCSILVVVVLAVWGGRKRGRAYYLPPGPRGLPLLGHLHLLGRLPHQSAARLSQSYGPLMYLRLGCRPAIFVSSPAMAKLILHTHDSIFSGRPAQISTVAKNAFQGYADILFSPPDSYWKYLRHVCFTEFFTTKRLECFRPLRDQEVRKLMRSIHAAAGTPVPIRETMYTFNTNIISAMTMGAPLQELASANPNSRHISSILLQDLGLLGMFTLGDLIPCLAWLDLLGFDRKSKRAAREARSVFQEVIDSRRAARAGSTTTSPRDFIDVLLETSLDPKYKHLHVGDQNIKSVLVDMFIGGTESSATTIEWAFAELLENPDKLKIVQEELDKEVGRMQLVEESNIPNLPYLQAVINETMRLHPPSGFLMPHMSMETCQIENYKIPAETLVFVNIWAIHRSPLIWENPLEFCPERFLDTSSEACAQQFKFMPFGIGKRGCPAKRQAYLTMQNVLANLLHHFKWTTLEKTKFQEKASLVVQLENPLVVVPTPNFPRSFF